MVRTTAGLMLATFLSVGCASTKKVDSSRLDEIHMRLEKLERSTRDLTRKQSDLLKEVENLQSRTQPPEEPPQDDAGVLLRALSPEDELEPAKYGVIAPGPILFAKPHDSGN